MFPSTPRSTGLDLDVRLSAHTHTTLTTDCGALRVNVVYCLRVRCGVGWCTCCSPGPSLPGGTGFFSPPSAGTFVLSGLSRCFQPPPSPAGSVLRRVSYSYRTDLRRRSHLTSTHKMVVSGRLGPRWGDASRDDSDSSRSLVLGPWSQSPRPILSSRAATIRPPPRLYLYFV